MMPKASALQHTCPPLTRFSCTQSFILVLHEERVKKEHVSGQLHMLVDELSELIIF